MTCLRLLHTYMPRHHSIECVSQSCTHAYSAVSLDIHYVFHSHHEQPTIISHYCAAHHCISHITCHIISIHMLHHCMSHHIISHLIIATSHLIISHHITSYLLCRGARMFLPLDDAYVLGARTRNTALARRTYRQKDKRS